MANQYPVVAAGQRATTNFYNAMIPVVIRKTGDTTRTSTTALADDPDLSYSLAANSVYFVEFLIRYGTSGAAGVAGFKTAWTVPSGASGLRSAVGPASTQNNSGADTITMHSGVHGFTTAETYGSRGTTVGNQLYAFETAVVTTTFAGTCALQWAQETSNAGGTKVAVDSIMRITQLA